MTNLDEEDRTYFDKHFDNLYKGQKDTDEQVATNTTDIGWLKKSHAAVVTVTGSVLAALLLWAVFGGG